MINSYNFDDKKIDRREIFKNRKVKSMKTNDENSKSVSSTSIKYQEEVKD